jgi:predicted MFS family arabinose efflux permease
MAIRITDRSQVVDLSAARAETGGVSLAIGGMLALASVMGVGRFVYTPILPSMAEGLGLTNTEAGWIASANFGGYLAGAMLTALPRLPGSRRLWFLGSLATGAASLLAMALADSMAAFLVLRFISGVCSALVMVVGSALVVERLAAMGGQKWAPLHFAGVGVGILVSAVAIGVLQADGASWRWQWIASAVLAAIVIPVIGRLVPGGEPPRVAAPRSSANSSEIGPALAVLNLCHGLFGLGYVVTATFIVSVVRAAPGAHALALAVWIVVGFAAIPSTAIWSWAGDRRGAITSYGWAFLFQAVGVAAGGLWPNAAGALLASVLLGGTIMGITAQGFAAVRSLAPERQRRSFAEMTAAFGVGQIVGPVAAGWLIDRTHGFAAPSLIGAAALAVGGALALRTAARIRRSEISGRGTAREI